MKNYKNISDYIKNSNKDIQKKLTEIRLLIKKLAPTAKEGISYGMPAYSWSPDLKNNKPLIYFAGMKGHLGIYPTSDPIKKHAKLLKDYSFSKGCVRIPYGVSIPKKIISILIKERMREIKSEFKITIKNKK